MHNRFRNLLMAALLLLPAACASSPGNPCTCGDPKTDLEGCANEICMSGETNPDNPDCVCGTLSIKE